jgi:hypothetical protein
MFVSFGTRTARASFTGIVVAAAAVLDAAGPLGHVHVARAASSGAGVVVSDAQLRFSARPVRTLSRVEVVEAFNPGPAAVRPRVRVLGGAFRLAPMATTCLRIAVLRAGEQCAVAVRFAPQSPGPKRGVLVLASASGRVLSRVRLSGVAQPAEVPSIFVLGLKPSLVNFGRQVVGTRSVPRTVTLTNPIARRVVISRVKISGAFPGNFRIGRQTCVGTLLPGRQCTVRVRFAPRFVAVRTATLVIVVRFLGPNPTATLTGRGASSVPSVRNAPLTLAAVDRSCFYAPSSPGAWPLSPLARPHAVRGGFNDPRGADMAHFGVDVSAHNEAVALAVRAGTMDGITSVGTPSDEHFTLESSDGVSRYFYYHVHPSLRDGTPVTGGDVLGHIERGFRHVHLSEIVSGCGLLDPRRPTGILHDPADTEAPAIGTLAAFRADTAAYRPFRMDVRPGRGPSTQVALSGLHGVVDMRADVSDTPRHETIQWPQQPLMVAGVRSFLAPVGRPGRHYGAVIKAFDGSRLIDPTRVFHVFAHGTYRLNGCFFSNRPCETVLRLHVAAGGFDTRQFANGNYLYCVSAITIRSRVAKRCTPVTIRN